jgi:hypothetical protein
MFAFSFLWFKLLFSFSLLSYFLFSGLLSFGEQIKIDMNVYITVEGSFELEVSSGASLSLF